jgi:polysaccharide lyase-like protein
MRTYVRVGIGIAAAVGLVVTGGAALATTGPKLPPGVFFQNEGTIVGWSEKPDPQKKGVVRDVTTPVYKGTTSIETQQTYISSDHKNYHAEVAYLHSQSMNQDMYYGQAIYLQPDWQFHRQPVTFQQFTPEKPEGPWLLFEIYNNIIEYSTHKTGYRTVGSIANLRGTWIRIVVRINMRKSGGVMEVWLNGVKMVSDKDNATPPRGTTLRWTTGIYPNYWDTNKPAGQRVLSVFHDNLRVASTYALADPASWG